MMADELYSKGMLANKTCVHGIGRREECGWKMALEWMFVIELFQLNAGGNVDEWILANWYFYNDERIMRANDDSGGWQWKIDSECWQRIMTVNYGSEWWQRIVFILAILCEWLGSELWQQLQRMKNDSECIGRELVTWECWLAKQNSWVYAQADRPYKNPSKSCKSSFEQKFQMI